MKTSMLTGAVALCLLSAPALSQEPPAIVTITLSAKMPSLTDDTKRDDFKIALADAEVASTIDLNCQAGRKAYLITVQRGCAWKGGGGVINAKVPGSKPIKRTSFRGEFKTQADSTTDMGEMFIDYAAIGQIPPSTDRLRGAMKLKPSLKQDVKSATRDKFEKWLGAQSTLSDSRTDLIQFDRVFIPSAGFLKDKGCTWSGEMLWAYATDVWLVDLTASCDIQGVKEFKLKGNMPWIDAPGQAGKEQLDLNLSLPVQGSAEVTDAAMFAEGDDAMFGSSAPGVQGSILLTPGSKVKTNVGGVEDTIAGSYEGTGAFTGTQVPLSVVRSLATLLTLNMSGILGG